MSYCTSSVKIECLDESPITKIMQLTTCSYIKQQSISKSISAFYRIDLQTMHINFFFQLIFKKSCTDMDMILYDNFYDNLCDKLFI